MRARSTAWRSLRIARFSSRVTSSTANALYPLPSRDALQARVKAAREQGPDGHNPKDLFVERRRREILVEYGVDAVEDLPINFDGIAMQLDEDFVNQLWDAHRDEIESQLARQSRLSRWGAVLNPFQSIDHISMTVAGTDLLHDLSFLHQAESYRRDLIGQLNHEHAYGGSKTGDRSFKATPAFFASLEPFHYASPSLLEALRHRTGELISLMLWLFSLFASLFIGGLRLERGTLPC